MARTVPEIGDARVARVFDSYPAELGERLRELRSLIFEVARETEGVGALEETLKWNQPSYLTPETGSGTTIRIDGTDSAGTGYAIYVHCQTTLIETFRELYGDRFRYEGNRALHFDIAEAIPREELANCIRMALTYHSRKRARAI